MGSAEAAFIESLRVAARDPAARDLDDDAAVLEYGGRSLVLTKDLIAEGVHYRPDDLPADVAWKLVAVNLSDLAAKGARPLGVLLGYTLGDGEWDRAFADGLRACLASFEVPLLGGDTVSVAGPRVLSLTVIGEATGPVPSRGGARAGDLLFVTGSIGDAGLGLAMLNGELPTEEEAVRRYRTPSPRLEAGQALAPLVAAMMDVSDGLLIDAARMAQASACGAQIELDDLPLSASLLAALGDGRGARLRAATAGDDYELLFAASAEAAAEIRALSERQGLPISRIGRFEKGSGLRITHGGEAIKLPARLGYEHGRR